jgi:hypothetical protein
MEKQLTAVEWLAKNLKDFPHVKHSQLFRDLVNQAKEMERKQIIDAFNSYPIIVMDAEQYYNETFKSE